MPIHIEMTVHVNTEAPDVVKLLSKSDFQILSHDCHEEIFGVAGVQFAVKCVPIFPNTSSSPADSALGVNVQNSNSTN